MKKSTGRWIASIVTLVIGGLLAVPGTASADDGVNTSQAGKQLQLNAPAPLIQAPEARVSEEDPTTVDIPIRTSASATSGATGLPVPERGFANVSGRRTPILEPTTKRRITGVGAAAGVQAGADAAPSGLRAAEDPILYWGWGPDQESQEPGSFYGTADWFQAYELLRDPPVIHKITRFTAISGTPQGNGTTIPPQLALGTGMYHLIEAYDTFDFTAGDADEKIIHETYMGGVLVHVDDVNTTGQQFLLWSVDLPANTSGVWEGNQAFMHTGQGAQMVFVQRMGYVTAGEFVPETDQYKLSVVFETESTDGTDFVGSRVPGSLFADDWTTTAPEDSDRVYKAKNGPLAFDGGTDPGVLVFKVQGVPLTDCDNGGEPDSLEVTCTDNPGLQGTLGCGAGECPYFGQMGSGVFEATPWDNPLWSVEGIATCIPAAIDNNTNGLKDDCEHDCNSNGTIDLFEVIAGTANDCNGNATPDVCDLPPICDPDVEKCDVDCDGDLIIDTCERLYQDCNGNNVEDYCDIHFTGDAVDDDVNGIPDACQLFGSSTMMDFEDKGPSPEFDTYNYETGPVSAQPVSAPPLDPTFGNGWWVQEFVEGNQVQTALTADVTAGALSGGCGGTQYLTFQESPDITVGAPQEPDPVPFGARSPLIQFAEPGTGTVLFAYVPGQQSVSMNLEFSHNTYGVDWEIDFTQFNENTLNQGSIIVRFVSDAGTGRDIEIVHGGGTYKTHRDWAGVAGNDLDHALKVTLDYQNFFNSLDLSDAVANVYWDNEALPLNSNSLYPELTIGQQANGLMYNLEQIGVSNFNSNGVPLSGGTLKIDCVEYVRSDNFDSFPDCNDNGKNDFTVDIAGGTSRDCNENEIPDECEIDFCNDCNRNGRLDECDLSAGTSLDTSPANDIPDECDGPIPALVSFEAAEGFQPGEIRGQNGWWHTGNGGIINDVAVVDIATPSVAGLFETTHFGGTRMLEMLGAPAPDPIAGVGFQFAGMPLYQGEEPSWETWEFSAALSTVTEALNVNVADLCDQDGGWTAGVIFTPEVLTGAWRLIHTYQLVDNVITEVPFSVSAIATSYRRGRPAAVRIEIARHWGNEAVRISVMNDDNTTDWVWGHTTETIATGWGGSGGDKQIVFSSDQLLSTKWFDEVKYSSDADCDWDGGSDAAYLALGTKPNGAPPSDTDGGAGHTPDGIPDRCQDCDNNGTLDPYELAGNDCNNNGILDACDINPDLPYVGWRDNPALANSCPNGSYVYNPGCFIVREGGGSTDCDGNGTPDDCQTTTWGDFSGSPYLQGDCNENGTPDECEIAAGTSNVDGDGNGQLDECFDCNHNGVDDFLDIGGTSDDRIINATGAEPGEPADGIPDECCPNDFGADFNNNGKIDLYDYQRLQQCQGHVQRKTNDSPGLGDTFLRLCGCADLNEDGEVNAVDQKIFQLIVTGP